ncbi:UPF0738 family protein [Cytobacillus horneckiae]|uniref:UPF0738 protein CWS20_15005 n=1 Tax=Cytobacillus horneckiae TaxID=549687 RepID=A0A2N0ZF65_9BACI|nr:hypothetical protein [Cytobacillus horneckiae]MCM3178584.1 hypothetical protein [Cytobacillus horneckiae]MEC1155595.1 hypothetical protein [Cytobacillus horneckiae]MED2936914.1 hypothetical protein [Cytobacillus horneckiae]PKG28150.1 hypothetical protein CWS20_15005 [Cytobacillus horneckiae]
MNTKINVNKAEWNEGKRQLHLIIGDEISLSELTPREQMLVDSDHLSFIYITEKDEDYSYIMLPDSIWPQLKVALAENGDIYLSQQNQILQLPLFQEELEYLIENIKGNSNYGEEMVNKVEEIFN